ncbi:TonB-dependent receptor, partial [bacterium]|nr:TonB-dependent receptor [bacterium]
TNYSVGAKTGPYLGITAAARFQDYSAEAGVPGPFSYPTTAAKQRDKQQDLALSLSRGSDSGTSLAGGSLAVSRSTVRNAFENNGSVTDNDSRTLTVDGQYSFSLPAAMTLTAGGNYQRSECESDNSGDHGIRQRAVFANALYRPMGGLLLAAGARYDRNVLYPAQYSPSISASYRLALPGGWMLAPYASWGRAFRAPTVNELFWRDDLWMMYGSDSLLPERSWQGEAWFKTERGTILATIAVFRRETRDQIQWRPMPDWSYRTINVGRVNATGIETSLSASPVSWLSLELNHTYCRTVQDDSTGAILPYHPQNIANGSLSVHDLQLAGHLRLGWKLAARYTDCQDPGPYVAQMLPRTIVCDQTLSIKIRDARVFWRADNLFNANYQTRYGYPMPRRSHAFGISIELWD